MIGDWVRYKPEGRMPDRGLSAIHILINGPVTWLRRNPWEAAQFRSGCWKQNRQHEFIIPSLFKRKHFVTLIYYVAKPNQPVKNAKIK
jgi:hypothetical protein